MNSDRFFRVIMIAAVGVFIAACGKKTPPAVASPAVHRHEHLAPHGGTPVVLGAETYHLELVLDRAAGKLSAFVMDGEMDNYIRLPAPNFTVVATVEGQARSLVFEAVADSATGEKVGDTALFTATAEWLKNVTSFDAVLAGIEIRGTSFSNIRFNFPQGNDRN